MAKRQVEWAHRVKTRLIESLGGECWACGARVDLEIDHPNGRDWSVRRAGLTWRVSKYQREAKEGLVRVLCRECNSSNAYNGVELARPGVNPF